MPYQGYSFRFEGTPEEVITHVRWCRGNLGTVGTDWDFASNSMGKVVTVWIVKDKDAAWYRLKFATVAKLNN